MRPRCKDRRAAVDARRDRHAGADGRVGERERRLLERNGDLHETAVFRADAHLVPARVIAQRDIERQVVEELVGEEHAVEPRGQLRQRADDGAAPGHDEPVVVGIGEHRAEDLVGGLEP
jgi:hypothetical protein